MHSNAGKNAGNYQLRISKETRVFAGFAFQFALSGIGRGDLDFRARPLAKMSSLCYDHISPVAGYGGKNVD
jgi:hypothetical protein